MNKQEIINRLYPRLGRYAYWLAEYGKKLDKDDVLVQKIMSAYTLFAACPENGAIAILMNRIDHFCKERKFEIPAEITGV